MSNLLEYAHYLSLFYYILEYPLLNFDSSSTINVSCTIYQTFFQWGASKEARAKIITAGLKNPTPDIGRAIAEVEAADKGKHSQFFFTHF